MQVTTINQSAKNQSTRMLNNNITLDIQEVKKHVEPQPVPSVVNKYVSEKVITNQENLLPWFVSVIKERLKDLKLIYQYSKGIAIELKYPNTTCIKRQNLKAEMRKLYYDNIRNATEIMYFIEQYLPDVYSMSSRMPRFVEVVYNKIQEFYYTVRSGSITYNQITIDEYNCISSLLKTLQDCEKIVIPFLRSDFPVKRMRTFVDYAGMDTIEPENEYNAITDIWADVTLKEDLDYEPSEYEDEDDEDDEDYVPDDDKSY